MHEDLIATSQYLKGAHRELGKGLLSRNCSDGTWSNGYKLKEEKFGIDIEKNFLL